MNWNIRNDAPVYTQLVDQIARAIILGQFPPGGRLPSVPGICSRRRCEPEHDAARVRRAGASGAHGRSARPGAP